MQFIDIAVNLGDPMFRGLYRGKRKHPDDLEAVLERAKAAGVTGQILTGTSLKESRIVLDLAKKYDVHSTAGCHPTSTTEIDKFPGGEEAYFTALENIITEDQAGDKRIVALGEIGLDYDRLQFAPRETQLKYLPRLLLLSKRFNLPMFLHDRHPEAHADLIRALREVGFDASWPSGVVHSFTGTIPEMEELLALGLCIGLNGCSLKTDDNLAVAKAVPRAALMLETDAPWCSITSTHASHKFLPAQPVVPRARPEKFQEGWGIKGRNEPADVVLVAHVLAGVRGEPVEELAAAAWENTCRVFFPALVPATKD